MKKLLAVLLMLCLVISLAACEDTNADATPGSKIEETTQSSENIEEATEIHTDPSEAVTEPTEAPTQAAPKPGFRLAVDPQPTLVGEEHRWVSEKELTFEFDPDDTWRSFIEKNEDAGLSVGKDFYGERDTIYYDDNGSLFEVFLSAGGFMNIAPDDAISEGDYVALVPHRESFQSQWYYEISSEPFTVEGYTEIFDRQAKTIRLDVTEMTYVVQHIKLKKLTDLSFIRDVQVIAEGKYTSSDGDTLGATLTFDNGYVLETNRSQYYSATLIADGQSYTATSADHYNIYS